MSWKIILKAKRPSPYIKAAAELLTDEWELTEDFFNRTLDLKTKQGKSFTDKLSRVSLISKLIRLGLAETTQDAKNNKIRRKQDIAKADVVDFLGEYERDKETGELDYTKPIPKAYYEKGKTFLNLTKIRDLEDFIESDLHETIHQASVNEIYAEIKKFLQEETKYLHNRPELYSISNGTVRSKKQLYDNLKQEIGKKLASHIAFTEIVTLLQSDSTNLNAPEDEIWDENGNLIDPDDNRFIAEDLQNYLPQFKDEANFFFKHIMKNIVIGAKNALGTDKRFWEITSKQDKRIYEIYKNRFIDDIARMAVKILVDTLTVNEDWDKSIDYSGNRTETIAEAKRRMEESKLNKSWKSILKNIQISSQRTSSKDYVKPEKDDEECCELLAKFIDEATGFDANNRFGDGMVGVPTFYDTGGIVPDDDFIEYIHENRDKNDMWNHFTDLLSRADDVEKEFERLQKLYADAVQHVLYHRDTCENIVKNLDKWSDRNFVGWKFYEDWVYPYTSSLSTPAKNLVDKDYERYMDSYRKIWIALLQNNCADILIPNDFMNYGVMKK